MMLKKIGYSMLVLLTVFALVACSGDNTKGDAQAAEKSVTSEYNTQFNFTTQKLDGSELKLADYKGKVVIVDMWDTWCPPCRKGIPEFVELHNEYKEQGLVIVGLAFGRDGKPAVDQFVATNGVSYVNGMINQDVVNKLGQPRGIPTTFVIDQNGNIYKKYTGYNAKSVFEADIKTLLNI